MVSIFESIDLESNPSRSFWTVPVQTSLKKLSEKIILQGLLKIPASDTKLKERPFILTSSKLIYMKKSAKLAKLESKIQWKKVEPFTEECSSDQRFGFRLGHKAIYQDFYTSSSSELDHWLDNLSKVAIMPDLEEDYAIIKEIGKGNYAQVYLAQDLGTHEQFAIKSISKELLLRTPRGVSSVIGEVDIMRKISHSGLVQLYKVYETESNVSLVLDYMPGGDFFQKLQKRDRFPEFLAAKFMVNMLETLRYLHENHIIHRDLKPENLLMTKIDSDIDFKICDFGLSCLSGDEQVLRCGSPGYVAPEILHRKPYTSKVDIFGAGVIMYIILCGNSPFHGKDTGDILLKNKQCKIIFEERHWKKISANGIDLVRRMLNPDPNQRLSADEALRHPWFSEYGKKRSSRLTTPVTIGIVQEVV